MTLPLYMADTRRLRVLAEQTESEARDLYARAEAKRLLAERLWSTIRGREQRDAVLGGRVRRVRVGD